MTSGLVAEKDKIYGLTPKQESFCRYYHVLKNASQAAMMAYPGQTPASAGQVGDQNLKKVEIQAYLTRMAAEELLDPAIMGVQERKKVLARIARSNVSEFVSPDGSLDITKDKLNTPGVGEYKTTRRYSKSGELIEEKTLKMRDAQTAIDLLNKMDRLYSENSATSNDNRVINVYVQDVATRDNLALLKTFSASPALDDGTTPAALPEPVTIEQSAQSTQTDNANSVIEQNGSPAMPEDVKPLPAAGTPKPARAVKPKSKVKARKVPATPNKSKKAGKT